jgi:hypothetical protein
MPKTEQEAVNEARERARAEDKVFNDVLKSYKESDEYKALQATKAESERRNLAAKLLDDHAFVSKLKYLDKEGQERRNVEIRYDFRIAQKRDRLNALNEAVSEMSLRFEHIAGHVEENAVKLKESCIATLRSIVESADPAVRNETRLQAIGLSIEMLKLMEPKVLDSRAESFDNVSSDEEED